MNKPVVKGIFQTTNGLIIIVKNERIYRVGELLQIEADLYRITGVIHNCDPVMADWVSLKVERA